MTLTRELNLCSSADEPLSENFLDYKNRGINGSHKGQIVWKIDSGSHFTDGKSCRHTPSANQGLACRVTSLHHGS